MSAILEQSAPHGLTDVQNEPDDRGVTIDRVGVTNIRYPVAVRDRRAERQHTVATVNMYVELPHHFRGTHMSRLHAAGRTLADGGLAAVRTRA